MLPRVRRDPDCSGDFTVAVYWQGDCWPCCASSTNADCGENSRDATTADLRKIDGAETSRLQQSAGMLQAREKKLENDVSGRVSESCEHFSIWCTVSRHSRWTRKHSWTQHAKHVILSTYVETTNITMTTDEGSNDDNDEEGKQGEQGQGGTKAIYTRYQQNKDWSV